MPEDVTESTSNRRATAPWPRRLVAMGCLAAALAGCGPGRRPHLVLISLDTVVPTTLAAHTSILTGLHPHTHGVPENGFRVHPYNRLLPEILRDEGYRTAAFVGSFALARRFGLDQGFDHYDEDFDLQLHPRHYDQNQRRANRVTRAVLDFLDLDRGETAAADPLGETLTAA